MNFELLPNEIILDLFEYISFIHLFRGFFNLNLRFNILLSEQFHKFYLDLRLISKTTFNYACQNYVPSVIDRIISLHLSNDDNTPQQIELFLSRTDYQLRQFIHLQSISISSLRSLETIDQIMVECSYLPRLTHLTFTNGHSLSIGKYYAQHLYNSIWSLSKLKYCHLDIDFCYESFFSNPTIVSTSIRHLIIPNGIISFGAFSHLCQCTPYLQYLSTGFVNDADQLQLSLPTLSITRLKILFNSSIDNLQYLLNSSINNLQYLLQHLPHLYHLSFEANNVYINGNQWKEVIDKYLPELKILELKMRFPLVNNKDTVIQINSILDSFRTKFWIEEHQWFVRCHLRQRCWVNSIDVFTLPYTFYSFNCDEDDILMKSTCPNDDESLICDRVNHLDHKSSHSIGSILSRICFSDIQSLSLRFPFDEQFLPFVVKLNRLTSLAVSVDENKNLNDVLLQLQMVLDRTSSLHTIRFDGWSPSISQVPPMEITSVSVRRLDLRGLNNNKWHCFDDKQCIQLSRSPLGMQCETLLIRVKNRKNILQLIDNMPNLQAINIGCKEDSWAGKDHFKSPEDNKLNEWLQQQLPSTCTIIKGAHLLAEVQIWIR
jgi:hypothetical protein